MVKFRCPYCGQKIAVNDEGIGAVISCPTCADGIVVPADTAAEFQAALTRPFGRAPRASAPDRPDPQTLLHSALLPHLARMMKDKLLQALMAQRKLLMTTQFTGTQQVVELEQRLTKIQAQYQHRLRTYEERIAQLEQQLAAKEAANSQLMRDLLVLSAQSIEAEAADADAAARLAEPGLLLRT